MPVVLIPGMLGSRLAHSDTGIEAWPGGTRKLLTSRYLDLALRIDPVTLEPLDDGLVPSGLFDAAIGMDFYGRIVKALREVGDYQLSTPGRPVVDQRARLYVFAYDWRQDNVATVRKLDALIEEIRRDYGDPKLRVDVVAHSMGGLIVRYYARYGTDDVLDGNSFPVTGAGAAKLRRVALLGMPHQGADARDPQVHQRLPGRHLAPADGGRRDHARRCSSSSRTRPWTGSPASTAARSSSTCSTSQPGGDSSGPSSTAACSGASPRSAASGQSRTYSSAGSRSGSSADGASSGR